MYPVLVKIGGLELYTQTVLIFLAGLAGLWLALRCADRLSVPREAVLDVTIWGFLAAMLGARALFVLLYWPYYRLYPIEILTLEGGGLSFQGGLLASGLAGLYIARRRGLNPWKVGDVMAPGLALALPIMRVGCLMNGCDSGIATTVPWGLPIGGVVRHPIQLYEAGANLLLLPLLWRLPLGRYERGALRPSPPGLAFLSYLFLSSLVRLGVDFYRPLEEKLPLGLTPPQLISLGMMGISGVWIAKLLLSGKGALDFSILPESPENYQKRCPSQGPGQRATKSTGSST